MNQYLVAIHYIQLLQAELDILNHDARLLFDLKIEPNLAKRELADLKVSLSKLSDKKPLYRRYNLVSTKFVCNH